MVARVLVVVEWRSIPDEWWYSHGLYSSGGLIFQVGLWLLACVGVRARQCVGERVRCPGRVKQEVGV